MKITGIAPADSSAYDGENRRIYSKDNGVPFVNFYDIFGNLLSQYDPGSAFYTTDYIWANGEPRMKIDTLIGGLGPLAPPSNPESQFWYHTDHLGTPYVATDSFKTVRWKISLDPFGERVSEQNPSTNNLRFPGQYFDRGSGLDYNWNRYYQPKIGWYYQVDPEGRLNSSDFEGESSQQFTLSSPPYSYALSSPLVLTDPTGKTIRLSTTFTVYKAEYPNFRTLVKLNCVNTLVGFRNEFVITDGTRKPEYTPLLQKAFGISNVNINSSHLRGNAVDISNILKIDPCDMARAAFKCGFVAVKNNYSDKHYHFDLEPGQVSGRSNLIKTCLCK